MGPTGAEAVLQRVAIRVPRPTVSRVLNHKEKGVTSIYDRHSYDGEKQYALSLWGWKLARVLKLDVDSGSEPEGWPDGWREWAPSWLKEAVEQEMALSQSKSDGDMGQE